MPGFVAYINADVHVPIGLTHLYYICFLSGIAISGAVYAALHYFFPDQRLKAFLDNAPPSRVLIADYTEFYDDMGESVNASGEDGKNNWTETSVPVV